MHTQTIIDDELVSKPPRANWSTDGIRKANGSDPKPDTGGWPKPLAPEVFHGLAGEIVRTIEPHSEADPAAILAQTLAFFGNVIGSGPHFQVESDYHRCNLDIVLVGETGKGRKGTSRARVAHVFETADPEWVKSRVTGGLSSGEGLLWACRDKIEKRVAIREKGRIVDYETEEIDPGITDKRLLVIEPEFARVLKMASRDGSILSELIRQAWECGNLRTMTKNTPAVATGAHISIIGHITRDELLRCLSETEQGNGFGNRFLWLCVKRSKYLPDDEDRRVDHEEMARLQLRIKSAVEFACAIGEMRRDDRSRMAWREVYKDLSDGRAGLLGAMLGRAEAQVLRLSMTYALMDRSAAIGLPHLKSALALWEYCEHSARFIFGDALGDQTADTILASLRNAPDGMTRTEISALFGRNKPASDISRALGVLASLGLSTCQHEHTDGRSIERWTAA